MNGQVAVFGKMPTAGDFVAAGASFPVAQAFQRWLMEENDLMTARGKVLPQAPVRFLYRDPSASGAILGVLSPSRDTVGRSFPLALMTYVNPSTAVQQFPSLPAAYSPFIDGAAALLQRAYQFHPAAFYQHTQTLPRPDAHELSEAYNWTYQALGATHGQTILEALFGPIQHGVHFHGIHMFRTACQRVRGNDPGNATIFLECPCADDLQLAFWLVFAQSQLGWTRAPPAIFWNAPQNPDHRMILALGAPTPGTLQFAADRTSQAERLWPTLSNSPASIMAGRQALSEAELRSFEPPAPTASALLAALAVTDVPG